MNEFWTFETVAWVFNTTAFVTGVGVAAFAAWVKEAFGVKEVA